ncbi:MAG: hypothetical protein IT435_08825 [Phycisphaerales bacterium]|nr:hypothetical protein [Phycisphaerales bacterium]
MSPTPPSPSTDSHGLRVASAATAPIQPPPGPLSAEHMQALAEARRRSKKVRRATGIAILSGWSMAFFAFITLIGGLFGDWASLILGAALGAIAFNELRGAGLLKRFDPRAGSILGYNQLVLGVVLVVYAGWSLWSALNHNALAAVGGSTGDPGIDEMVQGLSRTASYGVYGTLAIVGVIVPGLTAWYYFTRARHIRELTRATPAWVIETMRAAA